jgi:hypothetical protein
MKKNLPLLLTIIVLAASYRLFPNHIYNFTPIGAIALFSGAYLGKKAVSALIPMAIMLLSDIAIQLSGGTGFHIEMPFVYGAFLLTYFIGSKGLAGKVKPGRLLGASLVTSLLFFVITNFGSWILSPAYTKDLAGLVTCYVAAVPFYTPGDYLSSFALNGVIGDLFFTSLLFGAYYLITKAKPSLASSKNEIA